MGGCKVGEHAYVALSRARHRTTIWTIADDPDQALEQLSHDWDQTAAQDWVTVGHQPDPDPTAVRDRQLADLDAAMADIAAANAALDALGADDPAAATLARLDALQHAPEPEHDLGRDFGI